LFQDLGAPEGRFRELTKMFFSLTRATAMFCRIQVVFLCCGAVCAERPPREQSLLGFEADEIGQMIERLAKEKIEVKRTPPQVSGEVQHVTVGMSPWVGFRDWSLRRGQASQGQWAMELRPTTLSVWTGPRPGPKLDEIDRFYGLYERSVGVFNVAGVLRKVMPEDWSHFERLRFDVLIKGAPQTVHVAMEDEDIVPPVVRSVLVEPGKWTTVEVDLKAAAEERGLDPKYMATLRIGFTLGKGEDAARQARRSKVVPSALLDNLRLCSPTTAADLPLVRDDRPHRLPELFRQIASRPAPIELPPGEPDRSPIKLQDPFRVETPRPCFVSPVGWIAAYDNHRMLVGFNFGGTKDAYVWQTLDGGKTWRGWDDAGQPGLVPLREMTHQAGRGDIVGPRADVMLLTNLGCNGPASAGPTLFVERLSLGSDGWRRCDEPALVDCDLRHCNSNQSIVRATTGRLYAAYGYTSRLGTIAVGVRYSDDDGHTWKSWRPGKNGILPGGIHSQEDGIGFGYTFEEPCLVPLAKHVACIWCKRVGYEYREIKWSRFDGRQWTPVETIVKTKKRDAYNPTRPAVHAVSVGDGEVFMVNALYNGVLHYKDGRWTRDAGEIPAGSRISAAGNKHIVVIGSRGEESDLSTSPGVVEAKGAVDLQAWHRLANGDWKGPLTVAREPIPLASPDNRWYARPGFVVQPYAPPNFVPVAWSCGNNWVKVLRVPVVEQ
jgi:hypothetical protein